MRDAAAGGARRRWQGQHHDHRCAHHEGWRLTPTFFATPAEFRAWLHTNHAHATELIVGYYKKDTGLPSITWPESVDQALCYGWIDGIRRSHGAQSYTIRFTPRKAKSIWSTVNIGRVAALTELGLMMPAGNAAYARRDPARSEIYSFERQAMGLDAVAEAALKRKPNAWAFWHAQRPSYRRAVAHWVMSAKREETRSQRLATLTESCAKGRWIPAMIALQPAVARRAAEVSASRVAEVAAQAVKKVVKKAVTKSPLGAKRRPAASTAKRRRRP